MAVALLCLFACAKPDVLEEAKMACTNACRALYGQSSTAEVDWVGANEGKPTHAKCTCHLREKR